MQTVTVKSDGSAKRTFIEIDGVPVLGVKSLNVSASVEGDGLMHVTLEMAARVEMELVDPVVEKIS